MSFPTPRHPHPRDPGPQALATLDTTVVLMPAMVQELNLHTAQLAPPADAGQAARTGLWILLIGLGGFLAWAALAPLDRGVPVAGRVSVETKLKAVQHLTGGIVKEVLVREGGLVREGQAMFRLEESTSKANFEGVRQDYVGGLAVKARLSAELSGAGRINFPAELTSQGADPQLQQLIRTQEQLFNSRRAALRADLQVIEEGMRGQDEQLRSYASMAESRRAQLALLKEEIKSTADMVKDGYVPRSRARELERAVAEVEGQVQEQLGNMARARQAISELKVRAVARQQEYRKEIEAQMAEASKGVQAGSERFSAARGDLDRTVIRAPASGQVVGLQMQTVGGVVTPGQKLADIVPQGVPLLLEARVKPQLIDRLAPGLMADVRFQAFANTPELVVESQLVSVSGDLIIDPQHNNEAHYLALLKITDKGKQTLGSRVLQPGMPAEIIVKTGEQTLLNYLLGPFLKRLASSMKEG
jgi:protease secretion system membrane fusion protein